MTYSGILRLNTKQTNYIINDQNFIKYIQTLTNSILDKHLHTKDNDNYTITLIIILIKWFRYDIALLAKTQKGVLALYSPEVNDFFEWDFG